MIQHTGNFSSTTMLFFTPFCIPQHHHLADVTSEPAEILPYLNSLITQNLNPLCSTCSFTPSAQPQPCEEEGAVLSDPMVHSSSRYPTTLQLVWAFLQMLLEKQKPETATRKGNRAYTEVNLCTSSCFCHPEAFIWRVLPWQQFSLAHTPPDQTQR